MGEYSREFYSSRLQGLREAIRSCDRPVQLIVVSKNQDEEKMRILYSLGVRDFGENKVQELQTKAKNLQFPDLRWHFIGRLQTNKLRTLLKLSGLKSIHSVDSLKLLKALLANQSESHSGELEYYLQVNISGEKEKGGFAGYAQVREAIELIKTFPEVGRFKLVGLMGMGPIRAENFQNETLKCFKSLSDMRGAIREDYGLGLKLSMGMSEDWPLALECSSDVLRIGSYLFK